MGNRRMRGRTRRDSLGHIHLPVTPFPVVSSFLKLHREQFTQFLRRRLGAVLAKLERFSVPDLTASLFTVTPNQQIAVTVRHVSVSFDQPVADEVLPRFV